MGLQNESRLQARSQDLVWVTAATARWEELDQIA